MKHQILFSRKNKKNIIDLLSAESAHSTLSVDYLWIIVYSQNAEERYSRRSTEVTCQ